MIARTATGPDGAPASGEAEIPGDLAERLS